MQLSTLKKKEEDQRNTATDQRFWHKKWFGAGQKHIKNIQRNTKHNRAEEM